MRTTRRSDTRTIANDLNVFAQLACFSLDLDTVVQEFFKIRADSCVKDAVLRRFMVIKDKFVLGTSFSCCFNLSWGSDNAPDWVAGEAHHDWR